MEDFKVQQFQNNELFNGNLIVSRDTETDEVYFYAKQAATILGYKDTDQAIRIHCSDAKWLSKSQLTVLFGENTEANGVHFSNSGGKVISSKDMISLISNNQTSSDEIKSFLLSIADPDCVLVSNKQTKESAFYHTVVKRMFAKYEIIRQYPILGYKIDFYVPELKIAIEFDEKYHDDNIVKDQVRQKEIEDKLKCTFIRVPELGNI